MDMLELVQSIGLNPKWVAGTAGGEYHSPCPNCGGKDRFYIQPQRQMKSCLGYYRCRQCNISGDALWFARQFLNLDYRSNIVATNHHSTDRFKPAILKNPSLLWMEQAAKHVAQAHTQLFTNSTKLTYLSSRGISTDAIQQYKIGWSSQDTFIPRKEWGLVEELNQRGNPRALWIPKGIVIPTIANQHIIRLKIRRSDWYENDTYPKYVAISGSMNGLNLIGVYTNKVMIVVESELDAYAIHAATHEFALVVAVGSNIKNPDNITDHLAKNMPHLLICHDNDEAGKRMLAKWKKLYSHAIGYPTPIGKDIGEAIEQGLNVREWLMKA